jgi:hypothetical protein
MSSKITCHILFFLLGICTHNDIFVGGGGFSPGPLVSSTNKTDCHDITEILLKVALNTIKQTNKQNDVNVIIVTNFIKCQTMLTH